MGCKCGGSCEPELVKGADQDWLEIHEGIRDLHVRKSATYGTDEDRFSNFTAVAAITGEPAELYVAERMLEKLARVVNMIRAGDADAVKEWPDLASLALCGGAILNKRVDGNLGFQVSMRSSLPTP